MTEIFEFTVEYKKQEVILVLPSVRAQLQPTDWGTYLEHGFEAVNLRGVPGWCERELRLSECCKSGVVCAEDSSCLAFHGKEEMEPNDR